jgi:hypothetical protein
MEGGRPAELFANTGMGARFARASDRFPLVDAMLWLLVFMILLGTEYCCSCRWSGGSCGGEAGRDSDSARSLPVDAAGRRLHPRRGLQVSYDGTNLAVADLDMVVRGASSRYRPERVQ